MRFAITASDRYLAIFETLVTAGWEPVKVFTSVMDNKQHHNQAVIEYAQRLALDVQFSRMTETDLRDLSQKGCDVLVVASYNWRIGDWRPHLKYAINFHPSPLPESRGPYPMVQAILDQRKSWGVTCHKVSNEFDAGDILDSEHFPMGDYECHESLDLRNQMAAKRLAGRIAVNFKSLWEHAKPQEVGSYIGLWTNKERTVDFSGDVDQILRKIMAFGLIECLAVVNNTSIFIRRAVGWVEPHTHFPGYLVHVNGLSMVVAAKDGYIGIIEWSLLDQGAATGKIGR